MSFSSQKNMFYNALRCYSSIFIPLLFPCISFLSKINKFYPSHFLKQQVSEELDLQNSISWMIPPILAYENCQL